MKLIELYQVVFNVFLKQLQSIDRFMVKTDEQDIATLLKDDRDKVEFQKKVDKMVRENRKTDTMLIKNRKITI